MKCKNCDFQIFEGIDFFGKNYVLHRERINGLMENKCKNPEPKYS